MRSLLQNGNSSSTSKKKKRRTGVIQGTCGLSDAVQCVHKHPIFLELGKLLSRCLSKSIFR